MRGSAQVDEDHTYALEAPAQRGREPSQPLGPLPTPTMTPPLASTGSSGGPCTDRAPSPAVSAEGGAGPRRASAVASSRSSLPVSARPNDSPLQADLTANGTQNSLSPSDHNYATTSRESSFGTTSSEPAGTTERLDSEQASTSPRTTTTTADAVVVVGWCPSLKCGQAMRSWSMFVQHHSVVHVKEGVSLCQLCLQPVYDDREHRVDHQFDCSLCWAVFLRQDLLDEHRSSFHRLRSRRFGLAGRGVELQGRDDGVPVSALPREHGFVGVASAAF